MAKIQQDFCLYREPGLYPYPLSCKQLVHCSVGKNATVSTCPNGINFNPIISNCDYEQNIECNIPPNVTINTTHTNQPGFTTPIPQKILHNNRCILLPNGLIIDPFSCAHYLICSNSQTTRTKCEGGLLFNAKSLHCDHPQSVNCSISTPSTTITTPLNKCKYLPDGITKDPLSCAHFFICFVGNSYRFKCPAGLLFNSTSLVCDYAINVTC